jgi:hypothetical protein
MNRRDITSLAIAALAACAGLAVAADLLYRRSPELAAIQAGVDRGSYEDDDLKADETAPGALWAKDHPDRACDPADEEFQRGCIAARRAAGLPLGTSP